MKRELELLKNVSSSSSFKICDSRELQIIKSPYFANAISTSRLALEVTLALLLRIMNYPTSLFKNLANSKYALEKSWMSLFLFFLLINCSNNLPEEISLGEHKCEFCKMGVVNQNYHSQVLTKKGRRFHFDSIECMFSYWNKNSDKIENVWVKNYQSPKEWIEIQNAKFLKADNLPSPMAANLSSYKTQKDAEDNRVLYGGTLMTQKEVMEYVKTNWEKELAGKGK